MQCGGKWLSQGMIDLNSTMVAPEATQLPLMVMDARDVAHHILESGK